MAHISHTIKYLIHDFLQLIILKLENYTRKSS